MKYPFFKALVFYISIFNSLMLCFYSICFVETLQLFKLFVTSSTLCFTICGMYFMFNIKDVSKILFLDKLGIDITKE